MDVLDTNMTKYKNPTYQLQRQYLSISPMVISSNSIIPPSKPIHILNSALMCEPDHVNQAFLPDFQLRTTFRNGSHNFTCRFTPAHKNLKTTRTKSMISIHTGSHKFLRRFAPVHIINFCRFTLTETLIPNWLLFKPFLLSGGTQIFWDPVGRNCIFLRVCIKTVQKFSSCAVPNK